MAKTAKAEKTRRTLNRIVRDLTKLRTFEKGKQNFARDVLDFIVLRKRGNIKEAREVGKEIDAGIKKAKLDPDIVYFYFGDPDNPRMRDAVEEILRAYGYAW